MVYASSGTMKCFLYRDLGHKHLTCPHQQWEAVAETPSAGQSAETTWNGSEGLSSSGTASQSYTPQENNNFLVETFRKSG